MAARLQTTVREKGPAAWEQFWKEGNIFWDTGRSPRALIELEKAGKLPTTGNALVPGVGSGYDTLTLGTADRPCLGVDLAPTAVDAANKKRDEAGVPSSRAAFLAGDFFTFAPPAGFGPRFTLIWDYTFFCAITPDLRPQWATRMAALLAPKTGAPAS